MKRAVVLVPVLLFALAGCAPPSPDSAYLSTVRESVPALVDVADADLIELAGNVCHTFDQRGFEDGMVTVLAEAKKAGVSTQAMGKIAGAAVGAYCPAYAENFQ